MATAHNIDDGFRSYRHLAVRVLAQAFRDLANPARSSDCESARVFLTGSAMMVYWCRVAALDSLCLVNRAERLTTKRTHCSPSAACPDAAAHGLSRVIPE
jgi:hypothetical protein